MKEKRQEKKKTYSVAVPCPVCKKVGHQLKRHLMTVHKWDKKEAKNTRYTYGHRKERKRKDDLSCVTKQQVYRR